jgi:hypothetical protein
MISSTCFQDLVEPFSHYAWASNATHDNFLCDITLAFMAKACISSMIVEFAGTLPAEWARAPSLEKVGLSYNLITGTEPYSNGRWIYTSAQGSCSNGLFV